MIEIISLTSGEKYTYNEETQMIFKDGILMPSTTCEPVYSSFDESGIPKFSGIYLKTKKSILSLSGKINPITDINSLKLK